MAFSQAATEGLFMAKELNMKNSKSENRNGRTQSFSFTAPTATSVQLVGDFTLWQQEPINLQKRADGIWHTALELEPGPHRYRFLVDGQWRDDPECTVQVPNPFGGRDSVCQVA
jgi:1,4-alpha-glucan branching enzyme